MSVHRRFSRRIGLRSHTAVITALVVWISIGMVAVVAAQSTDLETPSPAQGRVQVVSQGMTNRPALGAAWRVVEREIPVRAEARPSVRLEGSAGFLLADDGPVFVIDQDTKQRFRLAPGEALFVPIGANQTWASTGDGPTTAYTLELAIRDTVDEAGNGEVIYNSGEFGMQEGDYDLDLLRGAQPKGESTTIPASRFPVLIFVTQGQVDIESDAGTERMYSGHAGAFEGDVLIRTASKNDAIFTAVVIGASVGGGRTSPEPTSTPTAEPAEVATAEATEPSDAQATAEATEPPGDDPAGESTPVPSTASAGTQDGTNASAAVDELGASPPEPSPAPTDEPAATSTPEPTPRPTFESRTGSAQIRLEVRVCPDGSTPESFDPDDCRRADGGFNLALVTPFGEELRLRHANRANNHFVRWSQLKSGIYVLEVRELPEGYGSFSLDGYVCCTQGDGYRIRLGRGESVVGTLYFFPE